MKFWSPAIELSPLVFRIRREDGTGNVRVLHRNLLLPFKTRIMDEEVSPPHTDNVDDNQAGTLVDSTEENQEESSDSEQDPDDISEEGDEPSVSTRPWTRSQGPLPALVGTQSLSRCSLNSPPSLLQELGGATKTKPKGFTGRLVGWASSMWEEFHPW